MSQIPQSVEQALKKGLVERLPVTFRPFINQQLNDWEKLFPFEQTNLVRILNYLGGLDELQFNQLLRPLRELEARMHVEQWPFSTRGETIENASYLARSAYYAQWRREVQEVFDEIDRGAPPAPGPEATKGRLILIILPACLPVNPQTVWEGWQGVGRKIALDLDRTSATRSFSEILLEGTGNPSAVPGFLNVLSQKPGHSASDLWILDAASELSAMLPEMSPARASLPSAIFLSYSQLKPLRDAFRDRLNAVRKDLADADAVLATLRQADLSAWCPAEIANQPVVREFLRALFLSGNGSVVFSNSFVEWAASEAFRRARPRVLIARFGTRYRPKPFTSVAVLEDQEKANPLPEIDDPEGSAVDAEILSRYIWLAASRHAEYSEALCLCVAESAPVAYAIGPPDNPLWRERQPVKMERISSALSDWVA
jgi:hypothetical protein